jgi:hypothetical protein
MISIIENNQQIHFQYHFLKNKWRRSQLKLYELVSEKLGSSINLEEMDTLYLKDIEMLKISIHWHDRSMCLKLVRSAGLTG